MTFWDVIKKTLEKAGKPLSAKEIWENAHALGTIGNFRTTGKTPWATIAAYCYTDILNKGKQSIVMQVSDRPAKFFLRKLSKGLELFESVSEEEIINVTETKSENSKFCEFDLHSLLSSFAFSDTHFKAHLKTIIHNNSKKATKGQNKWLHPDVVGVYFPFRGYKRETLEIQSHLSTSSLKLFSFEIKISLTFGNLRESYFQAVSNSSWANEGYLVVLKLDEDPGLMDELRRLNNAFGIGLIRLNRNHIFESEIVLPAKTKAEIDWDTVNRLANENVHFNDFLKSIAEDCKLGKVKSIYDKVLNEIEVSKYVIEKNIP